ncbi:MAG: murein biosynthesis integral membrane protein MurJ [Chloroflexi bacterium]|nr:murein biosynthesis integral membrane protein MurJ [Chloroflexota bacterium]
MTTSSQLAEAPLSTEGIAKAAGILALGNVASRVLGLVRETVKANLFGASSYVSAFEVAAIVPTMIYDLLIGGLLSAALVPVFSDYASSEKRQELWRIFSIVVSLAVVILGLIVILLELFAPQVAWLLGGGFDPQFQAVTTRMIRIILPAVLFFGLSGMVTGLLYTLKRFNYPAFGAAIYNAGVITAALLLADKVNIYSLALGILLGAMLQLAIQLPDLRDVRFSFSLDLSHPALRRIAGLYLPVVLGLVVSNIGIGIDRNLASRTGGESIAWMQYATRLIQLPIGLVSAAVSLAILPTLSQCGSEASSEQNSISNIQYPISDVKRETSNVKREMSDFQRTLALGLKMVLVAIIPATIGLFVLATPIVALLYQHGDFGARDTIQTAMALRYYLLGLTFAAIDLPLVFAFYARKDTLTPALVGVLGVVVYLIVALSLIRPLGMIGLILANSTQLTIHALTMLALIQRRLGGLGGHGIMALACKTLSASLVMGGVTYLVLSGLQGVLDVNTLVGKLAVVGGAGGVGVVTYLGMIALLRVEEARLVGEMIWRKVRPSS